MSHIPKGKAWALRSNPTIKKEARQIKEKVRSTFSNQPMTNKTSHANSKILYQQVNFILQYRHLAPLISWEIIGIKFRQIRIWPQSKQWDLGCTMECSGKRSIIKPKKEPQIVPRVKIKKIVILIHTKKEPKYLIKYWFFSIMKLLGWSL